MLKKKSFMKIISSILSISALCGFFACSMLDHSKKVESINASASVTDLSNSNFNVSSDDLVHYRLTGLGYPYYMTTYVPSGSVSGVRWILTCDTYTFLAGYVYDMTFTVPSSIASNIGGAAFFANMMNSRVTYIIKGSGDSWKKDGNVYTLRFKVNETFENSNLWGCNVTASSDFSGYDFKCLWGEYLENTNFVKSELVDSCLDFLGLSANDNPLRFNINFYYNGYLYYGLTISPYFSFLSLYSNDLVLINASRYDMLGDIQVVNGSDTTDTDLLGFFNLLFVLTGFNTYESNIISLQQYQETVSSLNAQITELQNQNNQLIIDNSALQNGVNSSYINGYNAGVSSIESQLQTYYNNGKAAGYNEGLSANGTAMTIISGIFQVALVPINFFLGIFNFEVLGINFTSLIQAIFTIALTIIIVKVILGKKGE